MSDARWLILADDLTGAADAGAAFARAGRHTEIAWPMTMVPEAEVHAFDLDSRGCDPTTAAARHREAVLGGLAADRSLFKKIDSTLRGHFDREIAAICAALREQGRANWGLLAPANPAMRRTTRDGRVFVAGVPLEQTETWQREHQHASADLGDIVRAAGLRPVKLPLDRVRGEANALRDALIQASAAAEGPGIIVICDAETSEDLDRIAAAAREAAAPGFHIGTAGLANALAGRPPAGGARFDLPPTKHGTLVAVGTLARISRAALERLAQQCGTGIVRIDPDEPRPAGALHAPLLRCEPVLALLDARDSGGPPDPDQVRAFAAALDAALQHMGALVVTGGETAAALLARCRVRGIRLLGEIEPGVALGVTRGAVEVPLVTKPGAFGDEDSLVRCLQELNRIRSNA